MDAIFEGSYLGDAARLSPGTRLECGICWWVYDPAIGDDVWQVPPGTAFADLDPDWRCPVCDAEKTKFMVLDGGVDPALADGPAPDAAAADQRRLEDLAAAYRAADERMRGLPVHNSALKVELVGFERVGADLVGIVVTPWFMNLTVLPPEGDSVEAGATVKRAFPSGAYELTGGWLDGVGAIATLSLFSPIDCFDDPAAARLAAEAVIDAVLAAPAPPEPAPAPAPPPPKTLDRRALFGGARAGA